MNIWKKLGLMCMALMMTTCTALFAVACGERDYNHINLNEVTHSIFYAPLYVAINKGYFEEEGLTVSLTNGGGSDTSMTALLTGSADMILAGPETVVYTSQEGVADAPVVFGQLTACDGSFIVGKKQNDEFKLSDLVGQTIIGGRKGGLPAMTLEYILKQNKFEIGEGEGKINLRTDVAFNLTSSVWSEDKSIEYCTLFEPTATNIEKEGKGHIVASLGELSGRIPYTCFAAKGSYLKDHGDVAKKFLKSVSKAYNFIQTASLDEVATALLPSFDGNSLDDMKNAVVSYKAISAWSSDMIMTEESFTNLMNVMLSAGVITKTSNFNDIVDNTLAKQVKAESLR